MSEAGGDRTDEALRRAGLADMRPAYRKLLLRLKQSDPATFDEASRRYREELEPEIAAGDCDPIQAWLEYGAWLASRLDEGRALAIDPSGRARPFDASAPSDGGAMVVHMPDDDRAPVTLLAMPAGPSESQRATAELLIG